MARDVKRVFGEAFCKKLQRTPPFWKKGSTQKLLFLLYQFVMTSPPPHATPRRDTIAPGGRYCGTFQSPRPHCASVTTHAVLRQTSSPGP
ncbi:hypothetical protein NJLHNGOC_08995 [Novacetimonas cocois]|uniref:Uncharacterized protein n=1 Tax=Novacetimonas cocois TaxID=1747507 RepID=A0A365YUS8_9PROT|nr:hypothetical protein NJLHNGOC_08995 [Novacetimonas cocois]